ncbi:MAG: flagellar hook assembly protein FlgD [Pseudomonadota bacterium]
MSTVQETSNVTSLFGAGAAKTSKSAAEETGDRFLALLVAQMKNQDPLNPLDNAQVTSQMAQLSTVQGIENMNKTLQAMAASMGVNQMVQAAGLIGRGVLVPGDSLRPAELQDIVGVDLSRAADRLTVDVFNAAGTLVRTLDFGPREAGINVMAWDRLDASGNAVPDGDYRFRINAQQGGEMVPATALHLGLVNSVTQDGSGVLLNLAGNGQASYADVRQIF